MPQEIEKKPQRFERTLPCVRASVEEIVALLEKIDIGGDSVTATSKSAKFVDLADIRSAPARFSGEPLVQVCLRTADGKEAYATVKFSKINTVVAEGEFHIYTGHDANNFALANRIFEELRPFSNSGEHYVAMISYYGVVVFAILQILSLFDWASGGKMYRSLPFEGQGLSAALAFLFLLTFVLDQLLKRRLPVTFNPRTTFWERHGEATVVGIGSSLFTGIILWYVIES